MATTTSLEQHEKNLTSVLKLDALLTIAGGVAGAVLLGRFGTPGILHGAWSGALAANVVVWSLVTLRGLWAGVNGRLRLQLVAPQQA